jgi:hypothetical protein
VGRKLWGQTTSYQQGDEGRHAPSHIAADWVAVPNNPIKKTQNLLNKRKKNIKGGKQDIKVKNLNQKATKLKTKTTKGRN